MMKTFMRIVEQADFDSNQHDVATLHNFGRREFSTPGKADLRVRRNDPRFADNPMMGANEPLEEFATDATADRLHQMLNAIPITDQQIKGGVTLSQAGLVKAAARLGIGPQDVKIITSMCWYSACGMPRTTIKRINCWQNSTTMPSTRSMNVTTKNSMSVIKNLMNVTTKNSTSVIKNLMNAMNAMTKNSMSVIKNSTNVTIKTLMTARMVKPTALFG